MLAVLDPLSFPFETMTDEQRDIPLLVMPPPDFDAETLTTVFGQALFDHLGPFDRIATADPKLWDALRRRYSWSNIQHVRLESKTPEEAAAELRPTLETSSERRYHEKADHRIEARALAPRVDVTRQALAGAPLDVLEVGAGGSHWPTSFDLPETRFQGVYQDPGTIEDARRNFPGYDFSPLEEGLAITHPDNTFNLSFSVNFMQVQPDSGRKAIVSEMWRVTSPGGRMVFVEDFVTGGTGHSDASPLSVSGFVDLVVEATAGRVVLDHVESLLYSGEDMFRGGLISLQKLGRHEGG